MMIKRSLPIVAAGLAAILAVVFLVWAVNRHEAQQADRLEADASTLIEADIWLRLENIEALLTQADTQSRARLYDAEKETLSQTVAAIDEVVPMIEAARGKLDEVAGMRVSEIRRQYLEARSRGLTAVLEMERIRREVAVTLHDDPAFARPETTGRIQELERQWGQQHSLWQAAEQEAARLAGQSQPATGPQA